MCVMFTLVIVSHVDFKNVLLETVLLGPMCPSSVWNSTRR